MMTDAEILEKVRMIKDYKQAVKQFQDELKAAEKQLRDMMDEKGVSEYCVDVFTIHYSDVETERFDSKAFMETHEKLYEQYLKTTFSKRFSIT